MQPARAARFGVCDVTIVACLVRIVRRDLRAAERPVGRSETDDVAPRGLADAAPPIRLTRDDVCDLAVLADVQAFLFLLPC